MRPSGEGHGLTFKWRKLNSIITRSCSTEAIGLQIKVVSIIADGARIHPYPALYCSFDISLRLVLLIMRT